MSEVQMTNLADYSVNIIVSARQNENGKTDICISYLDRQSVLSEELTRELLVSAISLSIKAQSKAGKGKDYEILQDVISHLEREFVSTVDFEDAVRGDIFDKIE
jgi:hypothetical protein